MNANLESLLKKQGATLESATPDQVRAAERDFREIADLGGYGSVGTSEGHIHPAYAGGLDVAGVLADSNTAVSEKAKARIAELTGVDRGAATKLVQDDGHLTRAEDGGAGTSKTPGASKADSKV